MTHTKAGTAFTELVINIFKLNGVLLEAGDALTKPVGQSSARWQVMGCVDSQALSVAAIARIMGLTRQSVQRTADILVLEELAKFEENPEHKRAQLLRLTTKGLLTLEQIETAQQKWANNLGKKLGQTELETINAALARIFEVL
jgi:DNA-binding MarR family transcriptional regulator